MSDEVIAALYISEQIAQLRAAVFYLTTAVSTLAVVGLVGYWVALRRANADKRTHDS